MSKHTHDWQYVLTYQPQIYSSDRFLFVCHCGAFKNVIPVEVKND